MSRSILEKYETDFDIRFTKNKKKIMKQMLRSVSKKCETDLDIRFTKK